MKTANVKFYFISTLLKKENVSLYIVIPSILVKIYSKHLINFNIYQFHLLSFIYKIYRFLFVMLPEDRYIVPEKPRLNKLKYFEI